MSRCARHTFLGDRHFAMPHSHGAAGSTHVPASFLVGSRFWDSITSESSTLQMPLLGFHPAAANCCFAVLQAFMAICPNVLAGGPVQLSTLVRLYN